MNGRNSVYRIMHKPLFSVGLHVAYMNSATVDNASLEVIPPFLKTIISSSKMSLF